VSRSAPRQASQRLAQRWSGRLHALIDERDALEPAFSPYDLLRFGSATSRDTWIDAMRRRFPVMKLMTSTADRQAKMLMLELQSTMRERESQLAAPSA
jgi:hypothetical protein